MAKISADKAATDTALAAIKPLKRSAVSLDESRCATWFAVVPRGTPRNSLTQPGLWAVVSDRMHAFDAIRAVCEDRSFYADLLVLDAGRGYANTHLLAFHPLPALVATEASLPVGFECAYHGPVQTNGSGGWCVKRIADGVLMIQAKATEREAMDALLDHASLR
ncbi:hypothetical protein [Pseudomonas indica]|uniref:hypothetical protein n=1 Tax=Pseudomonas indica TaxID=137658 RepID=UPI0023F8D44E|nr:hypothetical protein [Pseudomonas indica]MBU3055846.1 hypothetical protein [Pseudomonas indica]